MSVSQDPGMQVAHMHRTNYVEVHHVTLLIILYQAEILEALAVESRRETGQVTFRKPWL